MAPVHEGQAAVPDKGIRLDCLTAAQRWKYHGRLPGHHALLSGKSHVSSSAPPFRGHRPPFSVSSGAHSCPVDVFETACEEAPPTSLEETFRTERTALLRYRSEENTSELQ